MCDQIPVDWLIRRYGAFWVAPTSYFRLLFCSGMKLPEKVHFVKQSFEAVIESGDP